MGKVNPYRAKSKGTQKLTCLGRWSFRSISYKAATLAPAVTLSVRIESRDVPLRRYAFFA